MQQDLEISLFKLREDGELENYETAQLSDFGGILPAIGDHIAHAPAWLSIENANLFFVVKDRFFLREGRVALVTTFRIARPAERELF